MQIHELNKRKIVNELDLFGPTGIAGVGKQVLKNPAALVKSSALGAAKQASAQSSAEKSANLLSKQGYTVGGSTPATVTTAQQLQAVKTNSAVQQQIKTLASQWITQSAQLRKAPQPVSEAVAQFSPRDITDPKYASVLKAIQAQTAPKKSGPPGKSMPMQPYQVPGAGTNPAPAASAGYKSTAPAAAPAENNIELEKDLTVWKEQFKQWSDQKLSAPGVTMDMVRKDAPTAEALNKALSNVAVAAQSGDPKFENSAVEEYLNLAIAGIQAYVNNSQGKSPVARSGGSGTNPDAQSEDDQIKQQLQQIGITSAQLSELGTAMTQSNSGSNAIKDTGNPVLNAIAKLAGMKIQ
jgi:hypothetical protein